MTGQRAIQLMKRKRNCREARYFAWNKWLLSHDGKPIETLEEDLHRKLEGSPPYWRDYWKQRLENLRSRLVKYCNGTGLPYWLKGDSYLTVDSEGIIRICTYEDIYGKPEPLRKATIIYDTCSKWHYELRRGKWYCVYPSRYGYYPSKNGFSDHFKTKLALRPNGAPQFINEKPVTLEWKRVIRVSWWEKEANGRDLAQIERSKRHWELTSRPVPKQCDSLMGDQ